MLCRAGGALSMALMTSRRFPPPWQVEADSGRQQGDRRIRPSAAPEVVRRVKTLYQPELQSFLTVLRFDLLAAAGHIATGHPSFRSFSPWGVDLRTAAIGWSELCQVL